MRSLSLALLLLGGALSPLIAQLPPVVPGFPNVPQTPGTVLSGLNAPEQGRTAIIGYHNGILFTVPEVPSSAPNSDFAMRTWDLSDPSQPVMLSNEGITAMPVNAHGYFKSGDYLILGPNWPPESPYSYRRTGPGTVERTEFPGLLHIGVRGALFRPWLLGGTFWSYGEVSGDAYVELRGTELGRWDHLGMTGVIGHPFLLGNIAIYASDQSRTGVATYDLSDPANPVLLDVLNDGGPGGYWPELWGGNGRLLIVFPYRTAGNGIRIVDATDPTNLEFVADVPLNGTEAMYAQFQDEYAFVGDHKVDMRTFESVLFLDGANTVRPNDGGVGIDTSQFALPLGNLLITGGGASNQGMAVWAHQATPDTRGPEVGFHIPRAGATDYPQGAPISLLIHETLETPTIVNGVSFIVRPLGGTFIDGDLTFAFDDVLTFTPTSPLAANTTYEVLLPGGGIKDAVGNGMVEYSFTFSTGSTVGGNQPPVISSLEASAYPVAPNATLILSAIASDPNGDPVEYRFDFGDGTPQTAWSSAATANHTYPDPGHYRTAVQARDPSGSISSRSRTVTVTTVPAGPRPTQSSQLSCLETDRRVWAVNPDNDTVTAVDADGLAVDLEVPACDDPRSLAVSQNGEVWVACFGDDRIQILDGGSGSEVTSVATGYGSAPVQIVFDPTGAQAFVALSGTGAVRKFDATTHQEIGSLDLGPMPRALAITPDGQRLLVTRLLSPRNHAEVWDVDTASMTLNDTIILRKFGGEANWDTTASGRGVANYLTGIAIAPDGQSAWITANKPNAERGLLFGPDLDQDNTVRNVVVQIDLSSNEMIHAIDLDNSDSASAIAFSPLGDYLFVALQGNDEVVVLDAFRAGVVNGLGSLVTRLGVGAAPQGLCMDGPEQRLMAKNLTGRSVSALELTNLFAMGSPIATDQEIQTVASETMPADVLLGKEIFYGAGDLRMSSEGYIACSSCHLDGGHDGRVFDFTGRGEGLRNTTDLRGRGGTAHGNVHWSANFDEIQDFENDIRGAFGGTGFLSDSDFAATADPLGPVKAGLSIDLDALAAYVSSLGSQSVPRSPFRQANGLLTPQGVAGRTVFADQGCADCHTGPRFTDSTVGSATLHDVGTLRTTSGQRLGGPLLGIDTPTLRGAWTTSPYFHDGSAPTLADVFRVVGGTVIPAESGTVSNGAQITDTYVELNNDDTVHGRAYAHLPSTNSQVAFTGVDGGSGGLGAIEVRYSDYDARTLQIRVNGGAFQPLALAPAGNQPTWRHTNWLYARLEGVALNSGATNVVEVTSFDSFPLITVDELIVSTADEVNAAFPHRRVLALPPAGQQDLLAYLLQLDGQDEANPETPLFADGFESGNTIAWD
ncbi:MAG: Ig-like domain-containing protein [Thermoanaerobaculia bacterium]|nr:Ig-like domain-containing protein [Thermoanaerobaculia bacterium]